MLMILDPLAIHMCRWNLIPVNDCMLLLVGVKSFFPIFSSVMPFFRLCKQGIFVKSNFPIFIIFTHKNTRKITTKVGLSAIKESFIYLNPSNILRVLWFFKRLYLFSLHPLYGLMSFLLQFLAVWSMLISIYLQFKEAMKMTKLL